MARRIVAALAAAVVAGCGADAPTPAPAPPRSGVNLTAYTASGFSGDEARRAVDELVALGVRDVAVVTHWYMERRDSDAMRPVEGKTPSEASVQAVIARLRAAGVRVLLKPHVDVLDGTFRGDIAPADPRAWFSAYDAFVQQHAQLAQSAGVAGFVVGTELSSMQGETAAWRRLIASARRWYDGPVTYAANWSPGPEAIGFWDALDVVGVDAYVPLRGSTVAELAGAWAPTVARWRALARRVGKPLVLTELGYDDADVRLQARRYEAAVRAWSGAARAIYWWDWSAEGRRDAFTPRGRPATRIIARGKNQPG